MDRPDALQRLYLARGRLRRAGIRSLEDYRRDEQEVRAALGDLTPLVERALREGRDDVLGALFWDGEPDWSVCEFMGGRHARGLTIYYEAGAEGERRAWAALRAALGE